MREVVLYPRCCFFFRLVTIPDFWSRIRPSRVEFRLDAQVLVAGVA